MNRQKLYLPFFIFFLSVSCSSLFAQSIKGVYKIRLAAVKDKVDSILFDPVSNIGVVLYEPADNGYTRVYLGSYLGKKTAKDILRKVRKKGFKGAYIVEDRTDFVGVDGEQLTKTMQFSALSRLELTDLLARMQQHPNYSIAKEQFYIWKHKGFYRLCMGLMVDGDTVHSEMWATFIDGLGNYEVVYRDFRKIPAVKPDPQPQVQAVLTPSIEPVQKPASKGVRKAAGESVVEPVPEMEIKQVGKAN